VIGADTKKKTAITRTLLLHRLLGVAKGRKERPREEPKYFQRKAKRACFTTKNTKSGFRSVVSPP